MNAATAAGAATGAAALCCRRASALLHARAIARVRDARTRTPRDTGASWTLRTPAAPRTPARVTTCQSVSAVAATSLASSSLPAAACWRVLASVTCIDGAVQLRWAHSLSLLLRDALSTSNCLSSALRSWCAAHATRRDALAQARHARCRRRKLAPSLLLFLCCLDGGAAAWHVWRLGRLRPRARRVSGARRQRFRCGWRRLWRDAAPPQPKPSRRRLRRCGCACRRTGSGRRARAVAGADDG